MSRISGASPRLRVARADMLTGARAVPRLLKSSEASGGRRREGLDDPRASALPAAARASHTTAVGVGSSPVSVKSLSQRPEVTCTTGFTTTTGTGAGAGAGTGVASAAPNVVPVEWHVVHCSAFCETVTQPVKLKWYAV